MSDPILPEATLNLQGQLLLADPSLRDGIFHRSVVLLDDHSAADGAFGLVLNHPTGRCIGDILEGEAFEILKEVEVHQGGPVAIEQLTFAALWAPEPDVLRWETRISADTASTHIQRAGTLVRAFVGHSGWSPGQLEGEIRRSSWIPARPQPDLMKHPHDKSLWAEVLRGLSPYHRILAEAPADPFAN